MKKVLILLAICALAAPAFAQDVTFASTDNGDGTATVSMTVVADVNPVGLGLDVFTLTGTLDDVVMAPGSWYNIFLDAAYDMETATPGSYTYGAGAGPICGQLGPGALTMAEANASPHDGDFALCVGGLGGETLPLTAGPGMGDTVDVFVFSAAADATATLDENDLRGGVVGSTLTTNLPITVTITVVSECLKNTDPGYATWVAFGKPDCWCYRAQCKGDADGMSVFGRAVGAADLNLLKAAYNKTTAEVQAITNGICADFDHISVFGRPVGAADLNTLKANYNLTGVTDCDMTHINFWTN